MNGYTAKYIKDRNEAMLAYPDTSKLTRLISKYPLLFPNSFRLMWEKATPEVKVRTLEKMILAWKDAPLSLIGKVKDAAFNRIIGGFK